MEWYTAVPSDRVTPTYIPSYIDAHTEQEETTHTYRKCTTSIDIQDLMEYGSACFPTLNPRLSVLVVLREG